MSNIHTYNDLLEEKKNLEAMLAIQKGILHQDLIELKEEFRPALNLISVVGKMTGRNRNNPLIAMAVNLAGELFLKNVVLSRSSKIMQFVVPFLIKKVSSYVLNKNGNNLLKKLVTNRKRISQDEEVNQSIKIDLPGTPTDPSRH